jgi:hypothetical protein
MLVTLRSMHTVRTIRHILTTQVIPPKNNHKKQRPRPRLQVLTAEIISLTASENSCELYTEVHRAGAPLASEIVSNLPSLKEKRILQDKKRVALP